MDLKANTAVDVLIGPFVDKTDGNTTEDGLTLTQAEIKLSKNGQALTQKTDATNAAFDDDGYYNCELDATDTNTEGNLVLIVHQSANALPVRHEYNVLAEAAWDSLYVAKDTGFMDVNIKAVSEDTGAADNAEAFFDGTGYAGTNNVIPTVTTLTGHTNQTGDTFALANGAAGFAAIDTVVDTILVDTADMQPRVVAVEVDTSTTLDGKINTIDTNVDAILVDTGEIGAAGAGLTAINLPNQTMDITGNLSGSVGSVTGAVGSVIGNVGGTIDSLAAQAKLDVNAECDTALSDYDPPTNAEMEARTPTAAQLAYITAHAATAVPVTFASGTTTTGVLTDNTGVDGGDPSAVNDYYNGRVLIFNAGTLDQQVTDITDYVGATRTLTITAVTTAVTGAHTAIMV